MALGKGSRTQRATSEGVALWRTVKIDFENNN